MNFIGRKFISGKNINLRDIELEDAEFIYNLRLNYGKSRFISKIEADITKQIDFIKKYKQENKDFYFIIEDKNNNNLGTVRIYNIEGQQFCWGSWITIPNAPIFTAIESALLIYKFAFFIKNFSLTKFDVRKENFRVNEFHQRMGSKIYDEDELNYYYIFTKEDFIGIMPKYKKFI
ncbi:MAG: hypothetical protein SFT90_06695 [Rickettsiales bacterium]|nr:hypothetical protein [Rickettsiales bacterium]